MIESIKLRDFRGIKTGVIEGFRKINLLVGPNNSGKSAVLEAIYLACTASRPAGMTDEVDSERKPYDTTVAETDLFGDHPLQRIWAKHGYKLFQEGLSEWADGEIKVHQKDKKSSLPDFILRPKGNFDKGDERFTAIFGFESADGIERDEATQLQEISERILALKRDLEAPHDERITGLTAEQEKQRDELTESIQKELSGKEEKKGELEIQLRTRRERINRLADRLMQEGQPGFSQSRLIYCWHPSLSHNYKGDAAWIVKGKQFPTAKHTILYDLSKVTGYISLEFVRENFLKRPERLQELTKSFSRIFRLEQCAIQFQTAPEDSSLSQAWVAHEGQSFVPIDAFGDGARSVFKLLMTLHTLIGAVSEDEPGVLIWEEPELFQNPKTLAPFMQEIIFLLDNYPIQLFIASHSLESIADLISEKRLKPEAFRAVRARLEGGKLSTFVFNLDNLKDALDLGIDPRLWGDSELPLQFAYREESRETHND